MNKFAFVSATEECGYEYWKNECATKNEAVEAFVEQAKDYSILDEILAENGLKQAEELYNLDECQFFGENEQGYMVAVFFGTKTKNIYNKLRSMRKEFMSEF